jgi:hypothetical protein
MSGDGPDSEEVTLSGLEPASQLAVAAHLQARTLDSWSPHIVRSLEAQAARDQAEQEHHHMRAEAWRVVAQLARHPAALSAYVLIMLAWGIGGAAWATGFEPSELVDLVPAVTIGGGGEADGEADGEAAPPAPAPGLVDEVAP